MSDPRNQETPGSIRVTDQLLSTRRQSFRLNEIDHIEVSRPLLLTAAPIWAGCALVAIRFGDLLTVAEMFWLVGLPTVLGIAASQVGVLRLHSLSVRNECVWGRYGDLVDVRQLIETVMQSKTRATVVPLVDVTE